MRATVSSSWRWAIVGLLVLGAQAGRASDAATLRWKFRPGETLHYVIDWKSSTSTAGGDKKLDWKTSLTLDMDWAVKEVGGDGVAGLTLTVTRLRTRIDSVLGPFEYDSKAAEAPGGAMASSLVPLFRALAGAEFSFRMSPQGEVTDLQVPESVIRATREAGTLAGAGGVFSADGLKNLIAESALTVPAGEVARGASWKRHAKLPLPPLGALERDKTYTYQGPEAHAGKPAERIDVAIANRLERSPDVKLDAELRAQEGRGRYLFDNAAGRVAGGEVRERLELVYKLASAEIRQVQETSSTLTLVAGAPAK